MTNPHPIEGLMSTAMESLKAMVDVNTIVGEPIESPDGSIIIPISKVGFGFAAGGSEFGKSESKNDEEDSQQRPFGGGSGGGVTITPVAFLVANKQGVEMIHLDQQTHLYEKLVDVAPQALEKIKDMLSNNGKSDDSDK